MTTAAKRIGPARAILFGGLAVGVLDGLDAIVFFGFHAATPIRIFQSIAGGVLGRASFQGGVPSALLGLALHFFIATTIVAIYYVASTRIAMLTRRPLLCGAAYGLAAYLVMNLVVVPLSAAGGGTRSLPVVINGLFAHVFLVGIPGALAARWGGRVGDRGPGTGNREPEIRLTPGSPLRSPKP